MVDGKPIHEEAPGANLFIARTEAGERLVAAAAGAIALEPFTIEELDLQHADHVARKVENPARVCAIEMAGEPAPIFTRFRGERMVELAGVERDRKAEEGTQRRIRDHANREPLT